MSPKKCSCETPPFSYRDFISCLIGSDSAGELRVEKCIHCETFWICYQVAFEGYTGSGRWWQGKIEEKNIDFINTDNIEDYLINLDWYFYGGSYYRSTGRVGRGAIRLMP